PIFVPTPGAGPKEGHLICCLADPARGKTHLLIFDPHQLAKGPLARVEVPLQPYAFHGVSLPA
ncbi:MAG: carotenoid oxygenase family protein, partial [Myxococcaceae bacterium]